MSSSETARITISSKQITSIEPNGITYTDSDGNEQFIDFEPCYQNYLNRRLSPEAIENFKQWNPQMAHDVEGHILRVKNWKEVAQRNIIGDNWHQQIQSYMEFHSNPRVRIEFENQDDFYEMRHKVENEFRWRTFDLS